MQELTTAAQLEAYEPESAWLAHGVNVKTLLATLNSDGQLDRMPLMDRLNINCIVALSYRMRMTRDCDDPMRQADIDRARALELRALRHIDACGLARMTPSWVSPGDCEPSSP